MPAEGPPGSVISEDELKSVLASLYRQRVASPVLAIAKRSGLSTLVVIPALGRLVDENLASRLAVKDGSGRNTWCYGLTVQGRRTYQARI